MFNYIPVDNFFGDKHFYCSIDTYKDHYVMGFDLTSLLDCIGICH